MSRSGEHFSCHTFTEGDAFAFVGEANILRAVEDEGRLVVFREIQFRVKERITPVGVGIDKCIWKQLTEFIQSIDVVKMAMREQHTSHNPIPQ